MCKLKNHYDKIRHALLFLFIVPLFNCGDGRWDTIKKNIGDIPPEITQFFLTSDDRTPDSDITFTLNGRDNGKITHWIVSESSVKPEKDDAAWSGVKPLGYAITGDYGEIIIYAWAKDDEDNISDPKSIVVQYYDGISPVITDFTLISPSPTADPDITFTLDGTDNVAIAHWLVSESAGTPAADDPGWTEMQPAGFTLMENYGTHTVYAWVKDAEDNISDPGILTVDWAPQRVKITFDNSAQTENLLNFPVMVKIPTGSPIYTDIISPAGDDIRFIDSDGVTDLSYEIEWYDNTADSFIWVRVPQIDASSNTDHIWLYCGKSGLAAKSSGPSVFPPSEYNIVLHFTKDASGAASNIVFGNYTAGSEPTLYDSTGQWPLTWKFTATGGAAPTGTEGFQTATGMIGKGVTGAGNKTLFISGMDTRTPFSIGTYSLFINHANENRFNYFVTAGDYLTNPSGDSFYALSHRNTGYEQASYIGTFGGYTLAYTGLGVGTWRYIANTWDASVDVPSGSGSHNFGSVPANTSSTPVTFAIRNMGSSANLALSGSPYVSKSGTDADQFSISQPSSGSITSGDRVPFTITFSPTSTGVKTANITITSNDAGEGTYTFIVTGTATAVAEPEIELKQGTTEITSGSYTYTYDSIQTSTTSSPVTFTIRNRGSADLTLSGTPPDYVVVSGTDASQFTVVQPGSGTIAASYDATFTVTFAPTSTGLKTADITITNNDTNEGTFTFSVAGTAAAVNASPEIEVKQNTTAVISGSYNYNFGNILENYSSSAAAFTILNAGGANLTFSGTPRIAVSGTNASEFNVINRNVGTVGAGKMAAFYIIFAPVSSGAKTADITIANNDTDEGTFTFTVTGTCISASRKINVKKNVTGSEEWLQNFYYDTAWDGGGVMTNIPRPGTTAGYIYRFLGRFISDTQARTMPGTTDEMRWYKTWKSAAWLKAERLTGTDAFCTIGAPEIP